MNNSSKYENLLFQFLLFIIVLPSIYAFTECIGRTLAGRFLWISLLSIFFLISRKYKISSATYVYTYAIIIGYVLHNMYGIRDNFNNVVLARVVPVILLSVSYKQTRKPIFFIMFSILFYMFECGISIFEKISMTYFINYKTHEDFTALSKTVMESTDFRSISLMLHPLYNANTVSIFLIFILFSDFLKAKVKYFLLALGILSLWSFNSRASMLIWLVIIAYKFFFYRMKHIKLIFSIVILYLIIPYIWNYVTTSGLFGRLTEMTTLDDSSLTRIFAYEVFLNERWTLSDIIVGGRILYYPGTDISLENGVLLDLSYWGIIIGFIKVICEIIITYKAVINYYFMDRIFIMLAVWGVAFMNNNSFQTWIIPIFLMANITFNNYKPYNKALIK